ncbi:hypothetical protein U2P60_13165 [Brucella sp. H1_1004]|uniref:hypothetical protein n=1 Tax=Brucella sp. H1_1004 TaxID=3110109 RepID=UPI0039B599EC
MKPILDICCGSRMFWFDKKDSRAVFGDIREESHVLCDGRELIISPDRIIDFRSLPFYDETFNLAVFDPPHLVNAGVRSWFLRNRSGTVYSRFTLPDDFVVIREKCFPGDKRTLADIRRSGAIEAQAGGATPAETAAKMVNSISSANAIHKTYQPVDLTAVRQADAARRVGRQRMRYQNK